MKNRLFLVITFIMMLIGWTGCDSTKTSDELYSECSSGVVLVVNQYYHKITLPTGKVWYFSDFDEDGDLEDWTMDQEEILKNRKLITGTGFFISDKGVILTNNHVANPQIAVKDAKNSVRRVFSAMDEILKAAMQELSDQFDELEKSKSDCVQYNPYLEEYYVNEEKLNEIKTEQAQLKEQYEEFKQNKEQLKTMDLSDLSVETICDLGIMPLVITKMCVCIAEQVKYNQVTNVHFVEHIILVTTPLPELDDPFLLNVIIGCLHSIINGRICRRHVNTAGICTLMEGVHAVIGGSTHHLLQDSIVVGSHGSKGFTGGVQYVGACKATPSTLIVGWIFCFLRKVAGHHATKAGQHRLHAQFAHTVTDVLRQCLLTLIPPSWIRATPTFQIVHAPPSLKTRTCNESVGFFC